MPLGAIAPARHLLKKADMEKYTVYICHLRQKWHDRGFWGLGDARVYLDFQRKKNSLTIKNLELG